MNGPADRERIGELLQDESLSYREIAREAGCGDWTVRRIARDLDGGETPMKSASRPYDNDDAKPGFGIGLSSRASASSSALPGYGHATTDLPTSESASTFLICSRGTTK